MKRRKMLRRNQLRREQDTRLGEEHSDLGCRRARNMRKLHGDAGDRHVESAGKRRSRRAEARQNVGAWIQRAVAEVHSVDIGANKRRAKIVRRAHAKYRSDRSSRPDDVREQRLVRDYRYPAGFDIVVALTPLM